jgi:hypothetical protein
MLSLTSLRAARILSTQTLLRDIVIAFAVALLLLFGALVLATYGRTGHDCHDCDDYVPLYSRLVPSS